MRAFLAIELPPAIQNQVRIVQQNGQQQLNQLQLRGLFSWTPAQNVHLTLSFLGEIDAGQQRTLAERYARLVERQPAFQLGLTRLGFFPNARAPRIVWLGLDGDLTILDALQRSSEQLVQQIGFAPEERPFSPHLTIARTRRNAERRDLARAGQALLDPATELIPTGLNTPFQVNKIVLMRSELLPSGARYTPIQHFALQPAN